MLSSIDCIGNSSPATISRYENLVSKKKKKIEHSRELRFLISPPFRHKISHVYPEKDKFKVGRIRPKGMPYIYKVPRI